MNNILGVFILLAIFIIFMAALTLKKLGSNIRIGLLFLGIGLLFWMGNLGLLPYINWSRDWPWILIILGLWMVLRSIAGKLYSPEHKSRKKIGKILNDLESGKISPEEAIKKIKEGK
ncbi:MAG: LiaI-LiaF-like domain-containing protein [Candidatus Hydrothermia bacterium]